MMQKRKIKSIFWICGLVLVAAILVVLPFLMEARADIVTDQASILSARAKRASISTNLTGAGTLAQQESVSVSVPYGVKLTAFLVDNGEQVEEGAALATVDPLSVMTAITEVQDTLDTLKEQLEDAADQKAATDLTACVGGRVMRVYCSAGDDVKAVMLEHGALALVSLDGMLKVRFATQADVAVGDAVTVRRTDGSEADGRVEFALDGNVSVTIADDEADMEETVVILDGSGERLGSGTLEIHNPWRATAYTGTVKAVQAREGETIGDGASVCTLEDTEDISQYTLLTAKHRVYEEILTELFVLYQKKTVFAAQSGIVTLPEDTDAYLLSASSDSDYLMPLVNAPTGEDETQYLNFVGIVTEAADTGLRLEMQPTPVEVADYLEFAAQPISQAQMTESTVFVPEENTPVFFLEEGVWQQGTASALHVGDVLLFAYTTESKDPVWLVKLPTQESLPPEEEDKPVEGNPQPTPTPSNDAPENGQGFDRSSGYEGDLPSLQQGQFSQSALYAQYGGTPMEEAVATLYAEEETEIMTLTPCAQMELEIAVDEMDILLAQLGQSATVTVDALPGRSFAATVSEINTTGTNAGGSSKYTVTLTMARETEMLDGMNAFAIIPLEQHENILTVPVAALVERRGKTYVYRSYTDDGLGDLIAVTTGLSDGERVEILTGLSDNDEIFYAYYDKIEISNAVEAAQRDYFH